MVNRLLTDAEIEAMTQEQAILRDIIIRKPLVIPHHLVGHMIDINGLRTEFGTADRVMSRQEFIQRVIKPILDRIAGIQGRQNTDNHRVLLNERGQTHGDYTKMATTARNLKVAMRAGTQFDRLSAVPAESLDLIATKLARIVTGDPNCRDHWQDIIGYAQLALDRIGHKAYHPPENGA